MRGQSGQNRFSWNRWALTFVLVTSFQLGQPAASYADPPQWAPAWGYQGKHKHKGHKHDHLDHVYRHDHSDVADRTCHGVLIGGAIGAATGGVIGAAVSDSDTVAILGGVVLGAVVGGVVGHAIDRADADCAGRAVAYGKRGQAVKWRNPDRSVDYILVPVAEYRDGGQYCRRFIVEAIDGGKHHRQKGRACQGRDGVWHLVS